MSWYEMSLYWDVYQAMCDLVEHRELCLGASRFQRLPFQMIQHAGNTAGVVKSIGDVAGSSPLHHLNLLCLFLSVGIPYSGAVLYGWSHDCLVGLALQLFTFYVQVSTEEA